MQPAMAGHVFMQQKPKQPAVTGHIFMQQKPKQLVVTIKFG